MRTLTKEILPVILSGALTALAFPKFDLFFLGWISLIPLFWVIRKKTPGKSFLLGWIAGFAFHLLLLYWIPSVPAYYGGLSVTFSLIIYLAFALFLALLWGAFAALFSTIRMVYPRAVFLLAPFLWIVSEYTLTHFLTGFPWGLLGNCQYNNTLFIQSAAVLGVYGLSMLLVLFQSLFVYSMTFRKKAPFLFAVVLVLCVHLGGFLRLKTVPIENPAFKGAVIQGNVTAETDFTQLTTVQTLSLFDRHIDLSRQAFSQGSELLIWPELSVPMCYTCDYGLHPEYRRRLTDFIQDTQCTFLVGTYEITQKQSLSFYYNTATCLGPDLNPTFHYKMHLVPFGEYTPYKPVFSFISKFTHAIGELTPGHEYVMHDFSGYRFGSPICYEIIFPDIVRNFVRKGATFLVTITNDGWYGISSAPYQHFAIAVIRAVENKRYLLRSATTGISGIIDPYGRILERSTLNTTTFLSADITPISQFTFYTRYGYWLPFLSLTLSGIFFILAVAKKNAKRNLQ